MLEARQTIAAHGMILKIAGDNVHLAGKLWSDLTTGAMTLAELRIMSGDVPKAYDYDASASDEYIAYSGCSSFQAVSSSTRDADTSTVEFSRDGIC